MRSRPPVPDPEKERAAAAFVQAAGGRGEGPPEAPRRRSAARRSDAERPWESAWVRDDVMKGYALRLPEPLYLKLKWVAEATGQSINALCRDAVEAEVERRLREIGAG